MALALSELIVEVQALTGREDDTVLITSARVVRWLNEAQDNIVKVCIGHIDLETKDADAITLISGEYSYSLSYLSPTLRHFLKAYFMDGASSKQLDYLDTDKFDKAYPSPTDLSDGIPGEVTRRGSSIEVYPVPSDSEGACTEITLVETTTDTTWSTDGKTMTGTGSTWKTAGDSLVEAGDIVEILSGTNATAQYCQVVSVTSDTVMTLDRSIGTSPSSVDYLIYSAEKVLRIDYTKKPTVFSASSLTATCDMTDADEGLIYFGVSKAFKAIGGDKVSESDRYWGYYIDWLEKYRQEKDSLYMAGLNEFLPR